MVSHSEDSGGAVTVDVTLRGPLPPEHAAEFAAAHARAAVTAGLNWIEAPVPPGDPLAGVRALAAAAGPEHVAVRATAAGDPYALYAAGARLVRVGRGAPGGDPEGALRFAEQARRAGLLVAAEIGRAARLEARALDRLAASAADSGADVVVLADSDGSLVPAATARLVRAARAAAGGAAVGVHLRDELGLALANAIAALEAGAGWADCALLGLGPGPGTLRAERWLGYLARTGAARCDVRPLLAPAARLRTALPLAAHADQLLAQAARDDLASRLLSPAA
jgi:4-hydroxy 2-oxovalerate aldolase